MVYQWKYITNQMEAETRASIRKAVVISYYHDNNLLILSNTYPELLPLYARYHPMHLDLVNGYNTLITSGPAQQSTRVTVTLLFSAAKLLLTGTWMPTILLLYKKTTARFKAIFPNNLKPYNTGTIDSKIAAFNALATNIGADAALATVKAQVVLNYNGLLTARNAQMTAMANTAINSGNLEELRVDAMDMQYRNIGFVMDTFFVQRETLMPLLIDLETLREKKQTVFNGSLPALANKAVMAHTFLGTDKIRVKVTGSSSFNLFLASTVGGTDSDAINVLANIKTDINVADFGITDYANFRNLTIVGLSVDAASYRIELL